MLHAAERNIRNVCLHEYEPLRFHARIEDGSPRQTCDMRPRSRRSCSCVHVVQCAVCCVHGKSLPAAGFTVQKVLSSEASSCVSPARRRSYHTCPGWNPISGWRRSLTKHEKSNRTNCPLCIPHTIHVKEIEQSQTTEHESKIYTRWGAWKYRYKQARGRSCQRRVAML